MSRMPTTVTLWLIGLTGLALFLLFRVDRGTHQMNIGERFTYEDAVFLCENTEISCNYPFRVIEEHYGENVTPFRRYLEDRRMRIIENPSSDQVD